MVATTLPVFASSPAFADDGSSSSYDATASAYGFDFIFSNEVIPAGISPEGAGPVAQSELTSLPSGTSFASFPYPGDVVAGVPGLAGSIVTGLPTIPPYPAIVNGSYGQGPQSQNLPGIALSADTEAATAHAHATVGTEAQGSSADSQIINDPNGGVSSVAMSEDNGVGIGSIGTIGQVLSTASAVQQFDGSIKTSSDFEITGMKFPALDLTIPAMSPAPAPIPGVPIPQVPIPLAGTELKDPELSFDNGVFTVQLPGLGATQYQVPASAVLSAFQAAGITVTYAAPITTPTSVVGGTLTFHYVAPAPPSAIQSVPELGTAGATPVDVVFGRSSASISADSEGGDSVVPVTGVTDSVIPPPTDSDTPSVNTNTPVTNTPATGTTVTTTPTGTTAPPAVTAPTGGAASAPVSVTAPATTSGTGTQQPVTLAAGGGSPSGGSGIGLVRSAIPLSPLSWSIYLVLVAAGLVGTFTTQILRVLGVRHR